MICSRCGRPLQGLACAPEGTVQGPEAYSVGCILATAFSSSLICCPYLIKIRVLLHATAPAIEPFRPCFGVPILDPQTCVVFKLEYGAYVRDRASATRLRHLYSGPPSRLSSSMPLEEESVVTSTLYNLL